MLVKTILNRVYKFPSFVYEDVELRGQGEDMTLEVHIRPRANSRAICSGCDRPGPGYDTQPPRRFDFVPLWAIPVVFIYAMRRVDCANCGTKSKRRGGWVS